MFEVHVQIQIAGAFPSQDEHASRRALEQALAERNVGTNAGAGAGGGVMDVWVAVEDPKRALAQIHEILVLLGIRKQTIVKVRTLEPADDPPVPTSDDDALDDLELESRVLELTEEVDELTDQGDHDGAIASAERILEMVRAAERPGRSLTTALQCVAYALQAAGRGEDAIPLLREALAVGATRARERAGLLDHLGRVYRDLDRNAESAQALLEASALFQQDHPLAERDIRVHLALEALARTFKGTGNYLEAEALLRSCIGMIEAKERDERDDAKRAQLASTRIRISSTLAGIRHERGGDARAELEAVIRLIEAAPDQHRVSLVEPYELLAEIESKRGDHVAAEERQREALALHIELSGSDDPWVGHAYYKLALILKAAFDTTRALEACQRAAEIHRALSADDSMRHDTEALLAELQALVSPS